MIRGIYIENFKGIGEPGVRLELAPVTLLFGNNSAGKSTIFHALLYAYEVLVNRNYDVDRTTLGGDSVDLGGFLTFVHDHEPAHKITIEIELDLSSAQLDKEWRISEFLIGENDNEVDLSAIGTDVWSAKVKVQIAWDVARKRPFVTSFAIEIDDEWLLRTQCERIGGEVGSNINYRHPLFRWPTATGPNEQGSAGVLDELNSLFQSTSDRRFWAEGIELDQENLPDLNEVTYDASQLVKDEEYPERTRPSRLAFGQLPGPDVDFADYRVIEDVDNTSFVRFFYRYDTDSQMAELLGAEFTPGPEWDVGAAQREWQQRLEREQENVIPSIPVIDQKDAFPNLDRPIRLTLDPTLDSETRDVIQDLITRLAVGPARLLVVELKSFRHIGPLREVPPRTFQRTLSPDPSRWCSGLAAWDYLSAAEDDFIDKASDWLSSSGRLDTGYSLVRKRYKELDADGYIMRILKQENPLDDLSIALEGIEKLPDQTRLILRDDESLVDVDPPDIAVGINQLVPVIVSALDDHDGITLIEQPELHNHPAVEVGLGDLFVETIKQEHCRFILETHGEHLILRILRRIRETSDDELPDGVRGLSPDDIAVYYIDRNAEGVSATRLRVDQTGEFIDKWPKGFFRERSEELF